MVVYHLHGQFHFGKMVSKNSGLGSCLTSVQFSSFYQKRLQRLKTGIKNCDFTMEQEFTFVTSHPLFPKIFRWKDQKRRVSFTHFPVGFSGNIFVNHSMVNNRYFHTTPIRHMWVEFVVGSLHCSERFFSKSSGFPSPRSQIPIRSETHRHVSSSS